MYGKKVGNVLILYGEKWGLRVSVEACRTVGQELRCDDVCGQDDATEGARVRITLIRLNRLIRFLWGSESEIITVAWHTLRSKNT
jgi:hypothetical protein